MSKVRGIRGAIRIEENTKECIHRSTKELLAKMIKENDIDKDDIASVFFTATSDVNADFPAYATRELDWQMVPLLCAAEINVPHGMTRLIRILIHINTEKKQNQINHIYLGETQKLRPDLCGGKN
jgi:chorismate mutase